MKNINSYLNEKLKETYSEQDYNDIVLGYSKNRKTTFRVNTLKCSKDDVLEILDKNNIKYTSWNIYDNGFVLEDDVNKLKELDIYKNGFIYLQSLSSMIPPLFLNLNVSSILDMCAAPGSKTSMIAGMVNNNVSITALEKDKIRFERFKHNMNLLGVKNICLLNQDALKLDDFFTFDSILLDAPCSGSGTLSLLDNSMDKFSKELVKNSSVLQFKLLNKAINLLKKGQTLVYSTCSILKEENEEVINKILKNKNVELVKISLNDIPTLPSTIDGVITVKPSTDYEGFFIAKLRKK